MNGTTLIEVLLTGLMAALLAVTLPVSTRTAYAFDTGHIERLIPAESMEVETGGGEAPWVEYQPSFVLSNDAGYIERLLPAEPQVSEEAMGGGESRRIEYAEPLKFSHDAGHIERLLPADD